VRPPPPKGGFNKLRNGQQRQSSPAATISKPVTCFFICKPDQHLQSFHAKAGSRPSANAATVHSAAPNQTTPKRVSECVVNSTSPTAAAETNAVWAEAAAKRANYSPTQVTYIASSPPQGNSNVELEATGVQARVGDASSKEAEVKAFVCDVAIAVYYRRPLS
jgi:hypothetical protein